MSERPVTYSVPAAANFLANHCHAVAAGCGWWTDLETGERTSRNFGELIALCHSELSEAWEGYRKGSAADEHLPNRINWQTELADAAIRIFDMCGAMYVPIGQIMAEKLAYNQNRADHKLENRKKPNGKKS